MSFYIRFDSQYNTYKRQIYSVQAFLGDIGGLYSSLFSIGAIFISFFNNRLFLSAILKNLYQVKDFKGPVTINESLVPDEIELDYEKRDIFLKRNMNSRVKISENLIDVSPGIGLTDYKIIMEEQTQEIKTKKDTEQVIKDRELLFLGDSIL